MKVIIGRKLGMTRVFDANGKVSAVTLIKAGPCTVTQVKNKEEDGYEAVQIGYGLNKHTRKPQIGHLKNSKTDNLKYLREFEILENPDQSEDLRKISIGDQISVDSFKIGDIVTVCGVTKGKGFTGNIKRHGFTTGPKTHGSCNYRKPGSIGDTQPARVYKGKRMAGHMGVARSTIKNIQIVDVDTQNNLLALKGSLPGPNKAIVYVKAQ